LFLIEEAFNEKESFVNSEIQKYKVTANSNPGGLRQRGSGSREEANSVNIFDELRSTKTGLGIGT
jgi:hypothetical protein